MTRDELKGKIQTVLGPIAPEALGRTLMHEHVLSDIRQRPRSIAFGALSAHPPISRWLSQVPDARRSRQEAERRRRYCRGPA